MRLSDVRFKIKAQIDDWNKSDNNIELHDYLNISYDQYLELINTPYKFIRNNYYIDRCMLCDKKRKLTLHHLIPKKLHMKHSFIKKYSNDHLNECIDICNTCHTGIHRSYNENILGTELNTLKKLLANQRIFRMIEASANEKHK